MNKRLTRTYDVLIVGAGPAGLGMGLTLQTLGLKNFVLLERHEVGASFRRWPREMRMITPSFNSQAFGCLDLNAIAPYTSPAYTLKMEHPDGQSYATYLQLVSNYFKLPVRSGVNVKDVYPDADGNFQVHTENGDWRARFVIWAAGEYQYPKQPTFPGGEFCLHNSQVSSWQDVPGQRVVVIGGFESGIDAAVNLARMGKHVQVLERTTYPLWNSETLIEMFLAQAEQARRDLVPAQVGILLVAHGQPPKWDEIYPKQTKQETDFRLAIRDRLVRAGYPTENISLAWMESREPTPQQGLQDLLQQKVRLILVFSSSISAEGIHSTYEIPHMLSEVPLPEGVRLLNLGAWNDHPLVLQAIAERIESCLDEHSH